MSFTTFKTFDPYNVMDLQRTATMDEIKTRFKKLTLQYHPDRNRRRRNYDPKKYNDICKAYGILSSNNTRREYDDQFAPTFLDLRETNRDFIADQNKQTRSLVDIQAERDQFGGDKAKPPTFSSRGKFGDGDLAAFNQQFSRHRAVDPNDHGYGDGMSERMTEKEAKSWSSSVQTIRQKNIFKDRGFNTQDFNKIFEETSHKDASKEIIERSEIDPLAFSLASQTQYTDIAIHGGNMIIGRDTRDYTKTANHGADLSWVDYKQGFSTISGNLPNDVKDRFNENQSVDRLFEQRMAEQSRNPYDEIPENERKTFSEAKETVLKKKRRELEREQRLHRDIVIKYKDQYKNNYIEHKKSPHENKHPSKLKNTLHHPSHTPRPPHPTQNIQPSRHPSQSTYPAQSGHPSQTSSHTNRIHRYQAPSNLMDDGSGFNRQTRDRDNDAKNINNRMNERNFML